MQSTRTITLALYFWVISHGTLSITKSFPLCQNLKPVQDIFKKLHVNINQHFISPPFRVGRHTVFPPGICLSICLCPSVTKLCSLHNLKTVQAIFTKIQIISINIRWHADRKNHNTCIYTFCYFPCPSQNHGRSVTWNLFNISSRNFMKISINIICLSPLG